MVSLKRGCIAFTMRACDSDIQTRTFLQSPKCTHWSWIFLASQYGLILWFCISLEKAKSLDVLYQDPSNTRWVVAAWGQMARRGMDVGMEGKGIRLPDSCPLFSYQWFCKHASFSSLLSFKDWNGGVNRGHVSLKIMVNLTSWVALGHGDTIPLPSPVQQWFTEIPLKQGRTGPAKAMSNAEQTYLFLCTA